MPMPPKLEALAEMAEAWAATLPTVDPDSLNLIESLSETVIDAWPDDGITVEGIYGVMVGTSLATVSITQLTAVAPAGIDTTTLSAMAIALNALVVGKLATDLFAGEIEPRNTGS